MSYNLGFLKGRVKKILQEDPFFSDDDVVDAINRGIDDIVLFSKYTREIYTFPSVTSQQEYTLPDDFMCLHAVTFDGGRRMNEMTLDEWIDVNNTNVISGTPEKYMVRNNLYLTFDRPADRVADIKIFYTKKTTDLVLDADAVPIKREYSDCIVNYAIYWLYQNDNRTADAAAAYQQYRVSRGESSQELRMGIKRKIRRVVRN